jgi:formamidopyrimidine-DNA glycosylase
VHYARATETLKPLQIRGILEQAHAVMAEALTVGGTSFDALYVNVNGESGYFERGLNVYGQEGSPCPRDGRPIRREPFMNRSSYRCPKCQPVPRHVRW